MYYQKAEEEDTKFQLRALGKLDLEAFELTSCTRKYWKRRDISRRLNKLTKSVGRTTLFLDTYNPDDLIETKVA